MNSPRSRRNKRFEGTPVSEAPLLGRGSGAAQAQRWTSKRGKKMKQGLWACLVFAICGVSAAATYEHPIRTSYEDDGGEIGWYVSDTQFMKTPEWKFDGQSSPPLSMPDAYKRAYAWLKKSFPKIDSFGVRSYGLSTAGSSRAPNRWYYTFDFSGNLDGSMVMNSRFSVMVLMDGSVIEPRKIK